MVPPGDALPHRAHEEDRSLIAPAPRTDPQLFPRSKAAFQRRCRGSEQQSQSHHEKILRVPHLPLPRTRALSLTWQIARARINPRFLLTNLMYHRYTVEAAASMVGGIDYIYGMRGDGRTPVKWETAANQRQALDALAGTLKPAELAV